MRTWADGCGVPCHQHSAVAVYTFVASDKQTVGLPVATASLFMGLNKRCGRWQYQVYSHLLLCWVVLCRWKKTLIVVSHDREFLNSVTTDIIHLHDLKLHFYRGNFAQFEEMYEQKRREVNKTFEKYEKQIKAAKQSGKNAKANQEKVGRVGNSCLQLRVVHLAALNFYCKPMSGCLRVVLNCQRARNHCSLPCSVLIGLWWFYTPFKLKLNMFAVVPSSSGQGQCCSSASQALQWQEGWSGHSR